LEDSASAERFIEFKDSLAGGAATSRQAARILLRNLKLAEECPAPSNRAHQSDDWSCGIWVARWIERQLREVFDEPRLKPPSVSDCIARGNESIVKISGQVAKAKAKGKAETKSKAELKIFKNVEPVHESFEAALKAGLECSKCLPTKKGTKGCRACMGEHFEELRQKGFKSELSVE